MWVGNFFGQILLWSYILGLTDNNILGLTDNNILGLTDNNILGLTEKNILGLTDNNKFVLAKFYFGLIRFVCVYLLVTAKLNNNNTEFVWWWWWVGYIPIIESNQLYWLRLSWVLTISSPGTRTGFMLL